MEEDVMELRRLERERRDITKRIRVLRRKVRLNNLIKKERKGKVRYMNVMGEEQLVLPGSGR